MSTIYLCLFVSHLFLLFPHPAHLPPAVSLTYPPPLTFFSFALVSKCHSALSPSFSPSFPPCPVTLFLHAWLGIGLLTVGSRQTTAPASVTAAAAAVAAAAGTTAGLVEQGSMVAHLGHATPPPLLLLCSCLLHLILILPLLLYLLFHFSLPPPSLLPQHGSSEHDGWPHSQLHLPFTHHLQHWLCFHVTI